MPTKVLLVDDHPMLSSGLRQELVSRIDVEVVGQATDGRAALAMAAQFAPDLVIMDIHMPNIDGVAATREIQRLLRTVKIIIFTADGDQLRVDEALRAGACGYVLKSGPIDELVEAVRTVMQGRMFVSPDLTSGIVEGYRDTLTRGAANAGPLLSDKEKRLLRLLAAGKRSKEMADLLKLSPSSVETYRMRLKKKLGLQSTAELIRYAIANKIVEL